MRWALLALVVAATGCAAPARFEWGDYDQALYNYSRSPNARDAYMAALIKAVTRGRERGTLAPGLQAELGYMKLETGDVDTAVSLFEAEARTFPESAVYMRRVIQAVTAPPTNPLPAPAPTS